MRRVLPQHAQITVEPDKPFPESFQCLPEVRVPSGICGHLDLNGTGILQANNLSDRREGRVQPGCSGALKEEGWLKDDVPFP